MTSSRSYTGHDDSVTCLSFHPNGNYLVTGSEDLCCRMWDVTSGRYTMTFRQKFHLFIVSELNPKHSCKMKSMKLEVFCHFEFTLDRCVRVLTKHKSPITSVSVSPNGKQALSTARNGSIVLWDLASGRSIKDYINPAPAPLTNGENLHFLTVSNLCPQCKFLYD